MDKEKERGRVKTIPRFLEEHVRPRHVLAPQSKPHKQHNAVAETAHLLVARDIRHPHIMRQLEEMGLAEMLSCGLELRREYTSGFICLRDLPLHLNFAGLHSPTCHKPSQFSESICSFHS